MTQPTSRATFKEYCKRKLGHPVIELNLDDDQIEDTIDDAVSYCQEYHFEGTHPEYVKNQVKNSVIHIFKVSRRGVFKSDISWIYFH